MFSHEPADAQLLSGASPRVRPSLPHPPAREDLNWHVLKSEPQPLLFVARHFCDAEVVTKCAVAFQARRNMLELREGEEDTMEPLPY